MKQAFSFRLDHVLKGSSRLLLIGALLTMMLSIAAFAATPAAHAASPSIAQTMRCAVVIAPLQPGERTSRVLSSQCAQGNQPLVVPNTSTALITIYQNADFNQKTPGASTTIFGDAGPCDASGYHVDTMPIVNGFNFNNQVSSYKVHNNCNFVRLYPLADEMGNTCFESQGNVTTLVGTGFNDQTSSMRLTSAFVPKC